MEKMLLGYLVDIFKTHAESSKKMHEDMVNRWKNENSSDKLPEHMKDNFCLPEALGRMVEEIIEMKLEILELRKIVEDSLLRHMLISSGSHVDESVNNQSVEE